MRCPRCETSALVFDGRDGVMIDVCPKCFGVWLQLGELTKLIARAQRAFEEHERSRDSRCQRDESRQHEKPHKKKEERWFESLGNEFGGF